MRGLFILVLALGLASGAGAALTFVNAPSEPIGIGQTRTNTRGKSKGLPVFSCLAGSDKVQWPPVDSSLDWQEGSRREMDMGIGPRLRGGSDRWMRRPGA